MIPNRIVLDTNVCLDLFVFRDPRWHHLLQSLESGALEAVTRDDCRTEWRIVLGYTRLQLGETERAHCADEFDRLIRRMDCAKGDGEHLTDRAQQSADGAAALIKLPLCRDPDDQKFLELARDSGAATLLTKDKALLKLAGKIRRAGLFEIIPPQAWHPAPPNRERDNAPPPTRLHFPPQ